LPGPAWLWQPQQTQSHARDRLAITVILAFIVWWDFLVGHVLITAPFAEGPVVLDLTLVSGDVVATNRYHTTVIAN
jgi:hypothetical protein